MADTKKIIISNLDICEKTGETLKMSPKQVNDVVNGYFDETINLINEKKKYFDEIEVQGRIGIRVSKGSYNNEEGTKMDSWGVDLALQFKDFEALNDHLVIKEK